jgi:trigger factor
MQQNNQLPAMFADVRRGLTIAEVVEAATVSDTDGNTVDTEEFFGKGSESEAGDDAETAEVGEESASSEEPSGDTK